MAVLRGRSFRRFFIGYTTSLLGTSMSAVAVTFAVLDDGGSAADLGYVLAARILPQVALVLGGGVLADRIGRRPVMLAADGLRCGAQAALAVALLAGRPEVWVFAALAALVGTGDAFCGPALDGLMIEIAPSEELGSANALCGLTQSGTGIIGPALAGLLVALAGPAVVIAIDAASYAVSTLALAMLRPPDGRHGRTVPAAAVASSATTPAAAVAETTTPLPRSPPPPPPPLPRSRQPLPPQRAGRCGGRPRRGGPSLSPGPGCGPRPRSSRCST